MNVTARRTSESLTLGVLLALAAGSVEAYSLTTFRTFAGAQTANLVQLSVGLADLDWAQVGRFAVPITTFVVAALAAQLLHIPSVVRVVRYPYRVALTLELAILLLLGALPQRIPLVLGTVLLTSAVAVQATTFRRLRDVGYSTTFTTANLMTLITSVHTTVRERNHEHGRRARTIAAIVVSYASGAVVGAIVTRWLGHHGAWFPAAVVACSLAVFVVDERLARRELVD